MSSGLRQPTGLQRCALAATAAEARFRIDRPVLSTQGARVIALDRGAGAVLQRLIADGWPAQRLLQFLGSEPVVDADGPQARVQLRTNDGTHTYLSTELETADTIVMVASQADADGAASVVGQACFARGVMTAGVVVAPDGDVNATVAALRPHAMVLVILDGDDDLAEMLTALRV